MPTKTQRPAGEIALPPVTSGPTPLRNVRMPNPRWDIAGAICTELGTDRSALINELVEKFNQENMHLITTCKETKRDGSRCTRAAVEGSRFCKQHGGVSPV